MFDTKYISRNNLILFVDEFNKPLDNYIDVINKHCTIFLGISFDNDISILPPNITTIIFHSASIFNQEIKNLPCNLKKIIFGLYFNKSLDYIPVGLEELEFKSSSIFNCDLSNLPSTIKKITLGNIFSKSINNLPFNLEYLTISTLYNEEIKILPQKLKCLIFYEDMIDHYQSNSSLVSDKNYKFEIVKLPSSLIEIKYPQNYSYPISNLPKSLKTLKINYNYKFKNKIEINFPNVKIYYF